MQDIDGHTHNDCTKAKLCNAENCEAVDFFWCATEVHPDTRKMILWGKCDPSKCEGTDGTANEMKIREEYLRISLFSSQFTSCICSTAASLDLPSLLVAELGLLPGFE